MGGCCEGKREGFMGGQVSYGVLTGLNNFVCGFFWGRLQGGYSTGDHLVEAVLRRGLCRFGWCVALIRTLNYLRPTTTTTSLVCGVMEFKNACITETGLPCG